MQAADRRHLRRATSNPAKESADGHVTVAPTGPRRGGGILPLSGRKRAEGDIPRHGSVMCCCTPPQPQPSTTPPGPETKRLLDLQARMADPSLSERDRAAVEGQIEEELRKLTERETWRGVIGFSF